jgi:P27 family predicted phage terminase small subunit
VNNDEPPAPNGLPQCPDAVTDPQVREVWEYTVDQLAAMGCASTADRDLLACYCEAVVIHRKASAVLAQSSVLVRPRPKSEALIRNPALQVQRDSAATVSRLAQHFGLSPSARSEIRTSGGKSSGQGAERYLTG